MRNHGEGVSGSNLGQTQKVTLYQTSRLFIGILYIAAVVIVRTINFRAKTNKKKNWY